MVVLFRTVDNYYEQLAEIELFMSLVRIQQQKIDKELRLNHK